MEHQEFAVKLSRDFKVNYSDERGIVVFAFDLEGGESGGLIIGKNPLENGGRSQIELAKIHERVLAYLRLRGYKVKAY